MKEKIIFIGDGNHKKTKSDLFLIEYLREFYDFETHYDYYWTNGISPNYQTIANSDYKIIIFWLIFPKDKILEKLGNKTALFFAMYDACLRLTFKDWRKLKDVKIINFSSTLHKKLKRFGLRSCYLQYFPKPANQIYCGKKDEVFFWQRPNRFINVTVDAIFKILMAGNYKIHIHEKIDIAKESIAKSLVKHNHQITYSDWFDNKDDLNKIIQDKAIYLRPGLPMELGCLF